MLNEESSDPGFARSVAVICVTLGPCNAGDPLCDAQSEATEVSDL